MMPRFYLSERAERDLHSLKADSLREWGVEQTRSYLTKLEVRLQWLAENPNLGKARDDVREGLRSFPEGKHVVFYRVGVDGIEVVGVPHQRQELRRHFGT